ncbi:MAG: SDR family NAD(P)-dependent oxidoreductase [Cocleimonas sp.]|nr:SDR family NAD(P)-dependent oxidoreductase [Cocleimonas sp.]
MSSNFLIVGCGDIGRRVAGLYESQTIYGIVRSRKSKSTCEQENITTTVINLDKPYFFSSKQIPTLKNSHIFYFAPPPTTGKSDPRLEQFLKTVSEQPKRIVLISTTGVYGDSQGEWIDENAIINPKTDRAHRRASAEKLLQIWAQNHDKEFMILRVPGIYAQDRLPLARLKKGIATVNEHEAGWTNRIHADDLALACKAAMYCEQANHIINITDGNPSSITDYFNQVADYANLPRPPQISMKEAEVTLSEGLVSYLKESRRIKNEKMLILLGIKLKYPTLKHGLSLQKSS